jgi:flagellar basal body-associated protein FliL
MAGKKKGQDADGEGGKPKKDKKKIIAVVVLLAGAWKFGLLPIGGSKAAEGSTTTTEMHPGDAVDVGDPVVVNLADTDRDRYARVGIAIVLPGHGEESSAEEETTEGTSSRSSAGDEEESADRGSETSGSGNSGSGTSGSGTSDSEPSHSGSGSSDGESESTEAESADRESAALGAVPGRPVAGVILRSGGGSDPAAALEPKFPRLRAAAIEIIRSYTADELLARNGKAYLEDDLSEAADEIYGDEDIYGVIVTELIVQ